VLSLTRARASRFLCAVVVTAVAGAAEAQAQVAPAAGHEPGPSADVKACLDATEQGQKLRDGGAYLRARQRFIVCAGEQCPGEVRKTCVTWLEDLDKLVPTVVFAATAQGHDVTDVRVSVDGNVVAERIDGKPVPLDPGEHRFRFERPGEPAVEQPLVLRAGEKERVVSARFGPEPLPSPGAATPSATAPAPERPALGRDAFYALGALAIASFAAGVALDTSGYVFVQQCNGDATCSGAHERAEVEWRFVTGDILLAAGVAAGVTAWLLRPIESPSSRAGATTQVGVDATSRGASLRVQWPF
jgi:hypothetical protein